MAELMQQWRAFWADETGLTIVEYVVGAGLLIVGIVGAFSLMDSQLNTKLLAIIDSL